MMQKNKIVIFPHLAPFCQSLSHIYDTKMQITVIICSDTVFTIAV